MLVTIFINNKTVLYLFFKYIVTYHIRITFYCLHSISHALITGRFTFHL